MQVQKLVDADSDQVANVTIRIQAVFFAARDAAGIREAPMLLATSVGKEGTGFRCLIAHGNDQIHGWLMLKVLNAFGPVLAQINVELGLFAIPLAT
jgi:hypothetical protein